VSQRLCVGGRPELLRVDSPSVCSLPSPLGSLRKHREPETMCRGRPELRRVDAPSVCSLPSPLGSLGERREPETMCRERPELRRVDAPSVCSLPSPLGSLGERRELPQWGPAADAFLHILRHIALLVVRKMWFCCPGARFTKYLTTILRLAYDNAKVTIDLRRTSNLQNILWRAQGYSWVRFTCKVVRSSETVFAN